MSETMRQRIRAEAKKIIDSYIVSSWKENKVINATTIGSMRVYTRGLILSDMEILSRRDLVLDVIRLIQARPEWKELSIRMMNTTKGGTKV